MNEFILNGFIDGLTKLAIRDYADQKVLSKHRKSIRNKRFRKSIGHAVGRIAGRTALVTNAAIMPGSSVTTPLLVETAKRQKKSKSAIMRGVASSGEEFTRAAKRGAEMAQKAGKTIKRILKRAVTKR